MILEMHDSFKLHVAARIGAGNGIVKFKIAQVSSLDMLSKSISS
jgi:hypothetical protein